VSGLIRRYYHSWDAAARTHLVAIRLRPLSDHLGLRQVAPGVFRRRRRRGRGAVPVASTTADPASVIDELGQAVRRCADKVSESLGGSRYAAEEFVES